MTRAVILYFDDNDEAEKYVRQVSGVDDNGLAGVPYVRPNKYPVDETIFLDATVKAVVAVPTKPCRCRMPSTPTSRSAQRRASRKARVEGTGWTRGKHFGWWLCGTCHKPSIHAIRHWMSGMLNGANNLLPEILGIGAPLTPQQMWEDAGGTGTSFRNGPNMEHV